MFIRILCTFYFYFDFLFLLFIPDKNRAKFPNFSGHKTSVVYEREVFNNSIILSFLSKTLFLKKSTSPTYSQINVIFGILFSALTTKPCNLSYSILQGG